MSTTTTGARQGQGGGVVIRQFPVGRRRRYVPVVDAGCGCRPRRPARLLGLPSFFLLRTGGSCRPGGGGKTAVPSEGSRYCSSTSTDGSFSSSSCCAATRSTGYSSSSSAYSSDCYYYYHHHAYDGGRAAATKHQQQEQQPALHRAAGKKEVMSRKQLARRKKERHDDTTGEDEAYGDGGVGVAVEKDSTDPRADFRESMAQMVVEAGLRDWDGLRRMLRRLLALNAPRHHAAILAAFAEVCAQIVAAPEAPQPSPSPPPPAAYSQYQYRR